MSKSVFRDILLESRREKELLGVYADASDSENFLTATINRVFADSVIFNSFTTSGHYDGLVVKKIDNISKIEKDSMYIKKMKTILHSKEVNYPEITYRSEDGFECLLKFALENKKIITLELCESRNSDATGKVIEVGGKVIIENIDQYGKTDGISIVALQDITYLICDGEYERGLLIL